MYNSGAGVNIKTIFILAETVYATKRVNWRIVIIRIIRIIIVLHML